MTCHLLCPQGVDPQTRVAYEKELCGGTFPRGVAVLGDSVSAHFHLPENWFDATKISVVSATLRPSLSQISVVSAALRPSLSQISVVSAAPVSYTHLTLPTIRSV